MEISPKNAPLVENTAADTLFEGQTRGWNGINHRDVVSQNQNYPSFKNGWSTQRLSYIDVFLHCLPLKWLRIVIAPLKYGDLLRHLGLLVLMSTCYGWKREDFWSVTPFYQEENPFPFRLGGFMHKRRLNAITR